MNEMKWLESHLGTLEDSVDLANEFYWGLEITQIDNKWVVKSGEKPILLTDSKETLDAFIYGFGLAYSVIPDELVKKFRKMYHIDE